MSVSYKDNPELFEKTLRENLNSPNHTKESLINCAVQYATDAERYWFQLQDLEDKYGKLRGELNLAINLQNGLGSKTTKHIADIMASDFGAEFVANLLRLSAKGMYRQNKRNAKKHRTKLPSKEDLLRVKNGWIIEKGIERGWIKEAIRELDISRSKIDEIMKNSF